MGAVDGCERFLKTIVARLTGRSMAEGWRRDGTRLRPPAPRPDAAVAFRALARAWSVTMAALALLVAAQLLAPVCDRAIFVKALNDSLTSDAP